MINMILVGEDIELTSSYHFQGEDLEKNSKDNVHLLDETLFINNFGVEDVGDYQCSVTNQAGTSASNTLHLDMKGDKTSAHLTQLLERSH